MSKRTPPAPPRQQVEVIDPRWLLKAGGITLLVALLCAYITLCLLFYQGQWQFALQPTRPVAQTPAALNLPFESVRFGVDPAGAPQLTGWFIPTDSPNAATALVLHAGPGNIADALPAAQRLHTARLNVFVFDYRGYGASTGGHPTEALMLVDAETALTYLTATRGIAAKQIIPFGQGIGASLATALATQHHDLPALILESPIGDIDDSVAHDPRTKMLPIGLFLHEHFPLASPLAKLTTPKLILSYTTGAAPAAALHAADPKVTVELPNQNDVPYVQALNRFLDLYLPHTIPTLTPKP